MWNIETNNKLQFHWQVFIDLVNKMDFFPCQEEVYILLGTISIKRIFKSRKTCQCNFKCTIKCLLKTVKLTSSSLGKLFMTSTTFVSFSI